MTVTWLDRAASKVRNRDLMPCWSNELQAAFAGESVQITVCDVFEGYRVDELERIVLGVQVGGRNSFGSHIVKLGTAEKVRCDFEGWANCLLKGRVASRTLMAVSGSELPGGRYAAIYQDAYQLFGTDADLESPKMLERAVEWAIKDNNPDCRSLERVVVEIFSELNRCLYRGAHCDGQQVAAFYQVELKQGRSGNAWDRWQNDAELGLLRRDALWLATAGRKPDSNELPAYLDPLDYIRWAFEHERVPPSLLGRSHGDLHGRNVVVGVARGEVFQPAIFDFGEMGERNVLVWDFVKLETELKGRVLPKLLDVPQVAEALAEFVPRIRPQVGRTLRWPAHLREVAQRADRLEFALQFETALAILTREIVSRDVASHARRDGERTPCGQPAVDRALCLFLRLRQEAAYWLGFQMSRAGQWRDEYYFALAAYGLLTAKWPADATHLEWALMSAGVAAVQLERADDPAGIVRQLASPPPAEAPQRRAASHLVPLDWGHCLWKSKQYDAADELLKRAKQEFPHAVALAQEAALCLAAQGNLTAAESELKSLRPLCRVFRDFETLCRLGRVLKDSGDAAWEIDRPRFSQFIASSHSGYQLYNDAKGFYSEAFGFSGDYYPGINAATLALLTGDAHSSKLANEVRDICSQLSVTDLENRFWINATEGEAALVAGQADAVGFYEAAFGNPCARSQGMLQPVYNQLCRLHWALGPAPIEPILAAMGRLSVTPAEPGPLGNCGRA